MNYRDTTNHSWSALYRYATPIVWQLWPAIAFLGALSLIPFWGLGEVFSGGIMEFLAELTMPLSLALTAFFSGLSLLNLEGRMIYSFVLVCCNYWAGFSISLCSAALGVVVGLFFPYWVANDLSSALAFFFLGLIASLGYGALSHLSGVMAFSASQHYRLGRFKPWIGVAIAALGCGIAVIATYNQWLKLNDF
jgi:hypothetical protein